MSDAAAAGALRGGESDVLSFAAAFELGGVLLDLVVLPCLPPLLVGAVVPPLVGPSLEEVIVVAAASLMVTLPSPP